MTQSTYPTNLQVPKTEPSLSDLLSLHKKDIFLSMFCHGVATVVSFDPVTQKANATMNYTKEFVSRQADGTYLAVQRPYPPLSDCPVVFLGGVDSYLSFPDIVGSECLVLFNDRDLDNWFVNEGTVLNSSRLHSFSDAILIVGLRSNNKAIKNFDADRVLLKKGNAEIGVGLNNELVRVANEMHTLNGLLQQLITAIQSITVPTPSGPSGTPINSAAFSTVASNLNQLLE